MTSALSMSPVACWLIEVYQKWISPRKGFCCAYRVRHARRDSCSQYGKRAITRLGILAGLQLLRRRFDRCHAAAKRVLDYESRQKNKKAKATDTHSRSRSSDCNPASSCDVGGCDPGGCDPGGRDLPLDCGDVAGGCDLSI